MNKVLLLIICDFLVLSLLALANFDLKEMEKQQKQPKPDQEQLPDYSGGETDLVQVLTLALEHERASRQELEGELDENREQLQRQEELLAQRQQQIETVQEELQQTEQEAKTYAEQQRQTVAQYEQAQENLDDLRRQYELASAQAESSSEELQKLREELRAREKQTGRMEQQIAQLEQSKQAAEAARQRLQSDLHQVQTEKEVVSQQAQTLREQVQVVQGEKQQLQEHSTKLAEGVGTLAKSSEELSEEIREHRQLPANTIFDQFLSNKVSSRFNATRSGLFGRRVYWDNQTDTILIGDGSSAYAIYHVKETPVNFGHAGTDWERLTGFVRHGPITFSVTELSFLSADPRVIVVPVGQQQATELDTKVYPLPTDPLKFSTAVVINPESGNYAESKFQINPNAPNYIKFTGGFFSGLKGKFTPSAGDFVFSRTGKFLGLMVNNNYCALITNFETSRTIAAGPDTGNQEIGQIVSQMRAWKDFLPFELQ